MSTDIFPVRTESLYVPPHSTELESAVIGTLLLSSEAFDLVSHVLSPSDFYSPETAQIYTAILDLGKHNKPVDVFTVLEKLGPEVTSLQRLNKFAQYTLGNGNLQTYVETIKEKSMLRKLASVCSEVTAEIYESQTLDATEVLNRASRMVLEISDTKGKNTGGIKTIDEQLDALIEYTYSGAFSNGVKTGFDVIDEATFGLQRGDLIVVAGRPSMGKTSFVLNIAENVAFTQKLKILVVSLEMNSLQLTKKSVGSIGHIRQSAIASPELMTTEEGARLSKAIESMKGHVFDVVDASEATLEAVVAAARRSARNNKGLDLIVIDYIQLMTSKGSRSDENRAGELGRISRQLKALARELQCPVVVLSQLNRGVEERPNKRPMMSDLKDSGSIEQDADAIMMLYRDEYYTKEACKCPGIVEVDIIKQRMGPTGVVNLAWHAEYAKFGNL